MSVVIQQENEKVQVGVTGGRKDAAMFSLNFEDMRGREEQERKVSTGHFSKILSPHIERLYDSALQQTKEKGTLLCLILLF